MTWSLRVVGGDIVKGAGSALSTVSGSNKLVQDLEHWLLSNLGDDPLNPQYGSLLDAPAGTFIEFADGNTLFVSENREDLILSEIDRIIEEYQRRQFIRLEQEITAYDGRHTFSEGEIINSYVVEYEVVADTLYVDVVLETLAGVVTLALPFDL